MTRGERPHSSTQSVGLAALEGLLAALLDTARRIRPDHPEDLLQDCLVQLFRAQAAGKLPEFRSDSGLLAYARQTLRNVAATEYRRASAHAQNLESPDQTAAHQDDDSITGRPEAAEYELPPRARLSIVLRNRLGCSHELIARLLGHPTKEAGQCFHSRSLKRMREQTVRATV